MDREKELFEWIRGMYSEMRPEDKKDAERFFPALVESEDERIRKFLKDYAIEMIAGLESDISISVYDGVKGHDPDAEEEVGVAESPAKTFPRVNEFDCGSSYRG